MAIFFFKKNMYVHVCTVMVFLLEGKGNSRVGDILGSLKLSGIFYGGYHKELCICQDLGCNLPVLSGAHSELRLGPRG